MSKNYAISFKFSLVDKLTVPAKGLSVTMGGLSQSAKKAAGGIASYNAQIQKAAAPKTSLVGSIFKGVIAANLFSRALSGLGSTISGAIELGSDLVEVQNVVDTTFRENADSINKWSKTAITQFGLSELQAKQFTGTLGAMMKSGGLTGDVLVEMSTKMAGLAGDFASFYNLPIEEAFNKIRAGISGETEPLKQIGINMNVANLEAYALTQGLNKKYNAMSQAEQMTLRYNYLMKVSADAQGDFNKTLDTSYANQKRVTFTLLQQTLASIATKILPDLIAMFKNLTALLSSIDAEAVGDAIVKAVTVIKDVISTMIKIIAKAISIFWSMRYIIIVVVSAMSAYKAVMLAIIAVQWIKYLWMMRGAILAAVKAQWALNVAFTANPIAAVVAVVVALAAASYLVYKHWDSIVVTLKEAVNAVSKFFGFGDVFKIEKGTTADTAKAAKSMHQSKTETTLLLKAEEGTRATVEKTKSSGGKLKMQTNNGKTLSYTYDGMM